MELLNIKINQIENRNKREQTPQLHALFHSMHEKKLSFKNCFKAIVQIKCKNKEKNSCSRKEEKF